MSPAAGGTPLYIVTGAAGFIGARLAAGLIEEGARVIAVDEPEYFRSRPQIASQYAAGPPAQIVGRQEFPGWLESEAPAEVAALFHMGACADTALLDEAHLEAFNTAYTKTLWNWAAARGVPFYYASSAAVYGDGSKGYDDETPPEDLTPLNPYGRSKHRFDVWALGGGQARKPPAWAGFRFFNVYGFGEEHKGRMASVLCHAFGQIRRTGKLRLFRSHKAGVADGHQKRDFVFIDDVVEVLRHAARNGLPEGIYNVGTGRARTFLELAHAAFAALGREPNIEFFDIPEDIRSRYQYFTEAKMDKLRKTGYKCGFTPIEEGARRYWECLEARNIISQ